MAHVVVVAAAAAAGFELVVAAAAAAAVVAVAECGAGGVHVVTARAAAGAGVRGAPAAAVARLTPARPGPGAGAGRDRRPGAPAPASGHPRSASSGDRRHPVTTHTPPPPPSRPPSHAVTNRHTAAAPITESHSTAPRPHSSLSNVTDWRTAARRPATGGQSALGAGAGGGASVTLPDGAELSRAAWSGRSGEQPEQAPASVCQDVWIFFPRQTAVMNGRKMALDRRPPYCSEPVRRHGKTPTNAPKRQNTAVLHVINARRPMAGGIPENTAPESMEHVRQFSFHNDKCRCHRHLIVAKVDHSSHISVIVKSLIFLKGQVKLHQNALPSNSFHYHDTSSNFF